MAIHWVGKGVESERVGMGGWRGWTGNRPSAAVCWIFKQAQSFWNQIRGSACLCVSV